jgi:hypothetical protein
MPGRCFVNSGGWQQPPIFLEALMDNVTNRWLAQILMTPQRNPSSHSVSPRNESDVWLPVPGLLRSSGRRSAPSAIPAQSGGFDECFNDPDTAKLSTKGYDFCTPWGGFTRFPDDPKTGIRRYSFDGTFLGRDPKGAVSTYPGGSIINVHPDGTVTVEADI